MCHVGIYHVIYIYILYTSMGIYTNNMGWINVPTIYGDFLTIYIYIYISLKCGCNNAVNYKPSPSHDQDMV